ncbi:MAG: MFS transporter [Candidatus Thermofonsia Clade 1 bacterium]|jgi:DHA3 family macrolide efflux protein-like MFS transporter|uniref:MFS transporter n=1 Tax=Candidatus Thermofonsia Clade 1 bacterium TaxID=2364210 RepID=A0A2M8PI65_9CHLR|nr:MAG: MFS transporter [Candidatus Thermofonsia Clade 1 bacterium]RMF53835.1 MAG: MFS transporter [Chloroflexota bacterium]
MSRAAAWYGSRWQWRFFSIWSGQALSLLGSALVQFALIWWLTATTGSATALAMATLAAMLPQVLLSSFVGTLVDRWNRRMIMIVSDSMIALCTLIVALLFTSELVQLWHIYLLLMLRALGATFHTPAMHASTTLMVPEKHYARVAGINQALNGMTNILGPALGALLLRTLPLFGILLIDIMTALLAILPLLVFSVPQPQRSNALVKRSVWSEFREGLRYVWSWRGLTLLIGLAMLLNFLLTPAISLVPLLVAQHFQADAGGLAAMNMALGIGIIAGGAFLGLWGGFGRKIVTSLMGVLGIGVGILLIGVAPSSALWLAIMGMWIAGAMLSMANAPIHALLQARVMPEVQGRVFGLMNNLGIGITPLSLLIAGPLADAIGVQSWFLAAGVACVVAVAYGASNQALMNIEADRTSALRATSAEETSASDA